MKRNLKLGSLAALAAMLLTAVAQAIPVNITPATSAVATGNDTSEAVINALILSTYSTTQLYKQDVGGGETGTLAGSYNVTFANTPTDPADMTLTYTGGPILAPTAYLLLKDGSQVPAWYLFNLTALGWTGTEQVTATGFWPNQGAISHVSLYGAVGVPEGGSTLALLGLALAAVGLLRRKLHT
jgi:hypothetical protein